ncbi:hypothetical protein QR680_013220 [Steinernema hermaphroditum]|uniref:G-protein coupled receptors family 1 profile domain-containing protein n=1 Tax=Steinernema hermaphroditum TaxID=289476 RepID=A0AA39I4R6_9BILA|nr:hypothetical protein QR680_013220 [Steinernema hermaphroditum]
MEGVCAKAEEFRSSVVFKTILFFQSCFAVASLIVIVCSVVWIAKRRQVGHPNLKILFLNAFVFYAVFAVSELVTKGSTLFRYLFREDPCALVTVTSVCVGLRVPAYVCITAFTAIHLAIAFERFWATYWRENYERQGRALGVVLSVVTWLVSIAAQVVILWEVDVSEPRPYCNVTTKSNYRILYVYYATLILIDIFATMTHVVLLNFNRIRLRQMMERYNLSECYQLKENITVMRTLIPLVIFHTVIYSTYLGLSTTVRLLHDPSNYVTLVTFIEMSNIVSVYTTLLPLCILYLISRIHCGMQKKISSIIAPTANPQDVYFEELRTQWSKL